MPEIARPGQERFVAPIDATPLQETGTVDTTEPPQSQWKEAWKFLRKNPIFWVSSALLTVLAVVIIAPGLFTSADPTRCVLANSFGSAQPGSPLGFNRQGCDVFARVIYGARASVYVGVMCAIITTVLGLVTGVIAGFYGGWVDSLVSRIADMFFAIPLILGAIVGLSVINNLFPNRGFWGGTVAVIFAMSAFGWPQVTRISRGAVLSIKNLEFIDAARAIGATKRSNIIRHVVPNSMAPVIVTATISLGIFIVAEATLSFLGLGLPYGVVSWGNDISAGQNQIRSGQHIGVVFWPAGALMLTSLSFILLGDAVRDAFDPKARK